MFKFDFQVEEDKENEFLKIKDRENEKAKQVEVSSEIKPSKSEQGNTYWLTSKEIFLQNYLVKYFKEYIANSQQVSIHEIEIRKLVSGFILESMPHIEGRLSMKESVKKNSDLIPAVYEGGAKIWECTYDLLQYMGDKYATETWQNKLVLDLGCGAGLIGIYAYKCGAIVHFQDYNLDVVNHITMPNVVINTKRDNEKDCDLKEIAKKVKFYCGDWEKYAELTKTEPKFDFIFTCETIYNIDNQQKLINTLADRLIENGTVLLAAKTHYFGVGGGLRDFETLIEKDKRFEAEIVWTSQELTITREILKLEFKKKYI